MREIAERLKAYLARDRTGLRRELLLIFLQGGKYSSSEIHDLLKSKGYDVNQKGVSAMIGIIGSRLGIIKSEGGDKRKYYLKKEYVELVREIVEANL
jgi:arginine repressor